MLEKLRPYLKEILNPLVKQININPNIITLISPIIAILSVIAIVYGNLLIGGILILLSGFFDIIDGSVARYHNKTSKFGAFLDSTMDRFSDAIIIIGLILGGYLTWFIGILGIHSAMMISYLRASAESKGIDCTVGIAERAVRLLIIIIAIFIGAIINTQYIETTIIILVILSYITVFQRIYHVWKHSKESIWKIKTSKNLNNYANDSNYSVNDTNYNVNDTNYSVNDSDYSVNDNEY